MMTPQPAPHSRTAWPADAPVALRAFLEQRAEGYRAYAALLIDHEPVRRAALGFAVAEIAERWESEIAPAANPAAAAWRVVKDQLHAHADHPTGAETEDRRFLARDADDTDIALLAFTAGLDEAYIADLTGLDLAVIQARLYSCSEPGPGDPKTLPRGFAALTANWHDPFLGYTLTWCADQDHARDLLIDASEAGYQHWKSRPHGADTPAAAFQLLKTAIAAHQDVCTRPAAEPELHQALVALERRNPLHADCLRLRHLVSLDYPRTATLLGIGVNAARTATWNAFRFLEENLRERTTQP